MMWVHVSSLLAWRRPAVGVLRVERSFVHWVLERSSSRVPQEGPTQASVRFTAYLPQQSRLVEVPTEAVRAALQQSGKAPSGPQPPNQSDLHGLPEIAAQPGDAFVSLGLDWDTLNHAVLLQLKRRLGLRITLACYDLIPTRHPQHFRGVHAPGRFDAYLVDMAWCADDVVCISDHTRQDLEAYLAEVGAPRPRTHTIRLGCELPATPVAQSLPLPPDDRPFVLYVSTLESRKNHALLVRVWRRLREHQQPHRLVFVGMPGWGVDALLAELQSDAALREDVLILSHVPDEQLEALYRACAFTVYPSLMEGWGLPVVESLARGRLCLASNTTSLPEAGGGWAEHLDPTDEDAWVRRLAALMRHPTEVQAINARIAQGFKAPSWEGTARAIDAIARGA